MLNFDEIVKLSDAQAVSDAVNGTKQAQPAPQVETPEQPAVPSFASFLEQSEAFRRQQSEAWEKREKEASSRKTLAAVSDALSSLGNLVGTAYGAAPQRQTYQMPFVQQETEQERALARATAERLRNADQSYQMMLDRYAAQGELGDTRLAQEKERTNRALQVEGMRNAREGVRQGAMTDRNNATIESRNRNTDVNAATRVKTTGMNNASSERRNTETNEARKAVAEIRAANGGNVGGYTTETVINRNAYGQETGRTTTRTPAARPGVVDQPTTVTKTKKSNPMGSTKTEEGGKKKKKNPMN